MVGISMSYRIDFTKSAQKAIKKLAKSNPVRFHKLTEVLDSIVSNPRSGISHPEALKGGNGVTWSRHISAHDRIIYDIYDDVVTVIVLEVEGHYNDK